MSLGSVTTRRQAAPDDNDEIESSGTRRWSEKRYEKSLLPLSFSSRWIQFSTWFISMKCSNNVVQIFPMFDVDDDDDDNDGTN